LYRPINEASVEIHVSMSLLGKVGVFSDRVMLHCVCIYSANYNMFKLGTHSWIVMYVSAW